MQYCQLHHECNIFVSDGPDEVQLNRTNVPNTETNIYNLCPTNTGIDMKCSATIAYPRAEVTNMTITSSNGSQDVDCNTGNSECIHKFLPAAGGDHIMRCRGINSIFRTMENSSNDFHVFVRGKLYVPVLYIYNYLL